MEYDNSVRQGNRSRFLKNDGGNFLLVKKSSLSAEIYNIANRKDCRGAFMRRVKVGEML